MIDASRPTAWSKILAVRAALEAGYDLVLCMDADALVMNPDVAVEELFDWERHAMFAADHNGPNSGACLPAHACAPRLSDPPLFRRLARS